MEINMRILAYVVLVLEVTAAAFSQVLLKKSSKKQYKSWIFEYLNAYVIFGYFILFMAMLSQIFALHYLEYKDGMIVESLGYIIVMVLGSLFFQEKITRNKMIGTFLIFFGIAVYYV
jgi:drug/metabolite transporter (DMT)-like permease